ncbi:MAG TPA: hypothetical protein VNO79_07590 [Actinomycetota bacterium]|nr:hypothetical protein [Actinomycetota bacterium]HXF72453.1 hypothetical protein [Actinomycetota bacterium]
MPDPNWLWLLLPALFAFLEAWGLLSTRRGGRMRPATYWLRRAPGWLVAALLGGLTSWLAFHLWIEPLLRGG